MKTKFTLLILTLISLTTCSRNHEVKAPTENIFRYGMPNKIPSLDPVQTSDLYSAIVQSLVYEPLYESHPFKNGEILPLVADGLPKWSSDRKKLTLKIKKGIFFADDACFEGGKGRELKINDLLYTLERISAPKSLSAHYSSLEDRVVGINEFHQGKSNSISGIKIVDPYTMTIELTRALPRFDLNFTAINFSPVAKECVEKYGEKFSTHPVGTGAYKITEANLGSKVIAVKNPNYTHTTFPKDIAPEFGNLISKDDAGKKLPFIDKVVIEVIVESQPRWLKFLSGELDVLTIPKDNLNTAIPGGKLNPELEKRGVTLLKKALGDVVVIIFNMESPVWGERKELRHALALALDVPQIIDMQYSGQAIPAQSLVDPGMYGYDPKFKSKWMIRDLERSKKILAESGFAEGKGLPAVTQPSSSDSVMRQYNEMLVKQLATVGIKMEPEAMTWPEMVERMKKKNFVTIGLAYSSSVPDIEDATGLFQSKNITPGPNTANYKNPQVDKLIDEIESLPNGATRLAKIRKMLEILDEDLPYVPIAHRIGNQLIQPWVKNMTYADSYEIGRFMKYRKVNYEKKN